MASRRKSMLPVSPARARRAQSFYTRALSDAESLALQEAMHVEGLDEEIALLRVRLLQAVAERPDDLELMFKGTALLSRLLATRFGLSKSAAGDVSAAIDRAIAGLQELMVEAEDE